MPSPHALLVRSLGTVLLCVVAATDEAAAANPRTGRAFVFSGSTGAHILTLNAPDPEHRGRFGVSVAGIGDVNADTVPDIAVGAPGVDEPPARRSGRTYIFSGSTGTLLRTISSPAPASKARFGWSLAAAGDMDGDGAGDVVIGEPLGRPPSGGRAGRAFLASGADGSILAVLDSPTAAAGGRFGWSVAAGGDSDGNGMPEILVGAPGEWAGQRVAEGRVYLFDAGGALLAAFDDPEPQQSALFGGSLSFMPDADGDGLEEILAGADGQGVNKGDFAGKAFILRSVDPNDILVAVRTAPAPATQSNFGFAVAGLADLDGDGTGDLAASAPDQNTSEELGGAAFTLRGDPALVIPADYLLAGLDDPEPRPVALFGGSLAALPDLTGDLLPEIAVGAELHKNSAGYRTGRAYVLQAVSGAVVHILQSPTGDTCSRFGWSVASAGDVDGDTVADIVVGAPHHSETTRQIRRNCF